jgi:CheY-like chemotaxis protein
VRVAYDGTGAFEIAAEIRPEVFLLDLGLPGTDGYALARQLRGAGFDDALYIAVSGYAQPDDIEKSLEAGFGYHFAKPINMANLLETLRLPPGANLEPV